VGVEQVLDRVFAGAEFVFLRAWGCQLRRGEEWGRLHLLQRQYSAPSLTNFCP